MANLFKVLNTQKEKGVKFITPSGDLLTADQKEKAVKKDCIRFLKEEENAINKLEGFRTELEKTYIPIEEVEKTIKERISLEYIFNEGEKENADD